MKISAIFSKYMEGQEVSAYDKNDNVIDGIVRVKEGKKYILDNNGKIHLMTEMKKIKQIGRKLNEEAEAAYSDALQQFSDYYNDTFDTDKVEKAGDTVKEKIINQYADTSDDSAVKTNKEAFVKDALNSMNAKAAEQQIEAGNSTVDMEIEKLKKEQNDGELEESFFDNRRIQKAILHEMEVKKAEDADYIQPRSDYGMNSENRDNAADTCAMMIMNGASRDEVIEDLQLDFEISKDEATRMYDDIAIDIDETYNPIDVTGPLKQDIDDEIEELYDEALNHVPDELCGKNALIEYLGNKFGVDSEKALKESKDIGEAILNLVEQSKKLKEASYSTYYGGNGGVYRCKVSGPEDESEWIKDISSEENWKHCLRRLRKNSGNECKIYIDDICIRGCGDGIVKLDDGQYLHLKTSYSDADQDNLKSIEPFDGLVLENTYKDYITDVYIRLDKITHIKVD